MEINYNLKKVGNERVITAVLPITLMGKINVLKKKDLKIPLVDGNSIKMVKFHYFINEEKRKCYVKFTLHQFSNMNIIDRLIEAADKMVRMING